MAAAYIKTYAFNILIYKLAFIILLRLLNFINSSLF